MPNGICLSEGLVPGGGIHANPVGVGGGPGAGGGGLHQGLGVAHQDGEGGHAQERTYLRESLARHKPPSPLL